MTGRVRASLEAKMALGMSPAAAAAAVHAEGIATGSLATLHKYACTLRREEPKVLPAPGTGTKTAKDYKLPKPGLARYRAEFATGAARGRYVVVDPDGRRVGAPTTEDVAVARAAQLNREADEKARRGPRACICCGKGFESEGIHNRMCGPCRGRNDALGAYGYAGAADGRKPRKSAGAF